MKIAENIAEDYKRLFKTRIQYINRKSLGMQTKDLLRDNENIFQIFLKDKQFVRKFVDSRNYFTHYDSKKKMPSENAILLLTERFCVLW